MNRCATPKAARHTKTVSVWDLTSQTNEFRRAAVEANRATQHRDRCIVIGTWWFFGYSAVLVSSKSLIVIRVGEQKEL
jgi:hypothetical protein